MSQTLRNVIENIMQKLQKLEEVRDNVIKETRDVLKLCREIVMNIHKGDLENAEKLYAQLREKVEKLISEVRNYPQLYYTGLLTGPLTEYVEASILLSIVKSGRIPTPEELNVEYIPYLLGLGDVVGELRRLILDALRREDLALGEKYFNYMEEIYENLSLIVVPDALVPGLKSKVDFVRKMVEVTRADLLIARFKLVPSVGREVEVSTEEEKRGGEE